MLGPPAMLWCIASTRSVTPLVASTARRVAPRRSSRGVRAVFGVRWWAGIWRHHTLKRARRHEAGGGSAVVAPKSKWVRMAALARIGRAAGRNWGAERFSTTPIRTDRTFASCVLVWDRVVAAW